MSNPLVGVLEEIMQERQKRQQESLQAKEEGIQKQAAAIIKTLRQKILDADKRNVKSVPVMDCQGGASGPDSLCGASRIVYDACIEAKLIIELRPTSEKIYGGDYVDGVMMYIKLE